MNSETSTDVPEEESFLLGLARNSVAARYECRHDAGTKLSALLSSTELTYDTLCFVPNGGAPVGFEIAISQGQKLLPCPVVKIPSRFDPRFGIGALMESGAPILNWEACELLDGWGANLESLIAAARARQVRIMEALGYASHSLDAIRGRSVLLVDDGLASGYSLLAAIRSLRPYRPLSLSCAVPVASAVGSQLIKSEGVKLITPWIEHGPVYLTDAFYHDFSEVSLDQVVSLLDKRDTTIAPT
jgi:predicted phosphoribosyltransferase